MSLPPKRRVRWAKSYRVISTRYPPIDVFERVAEPSDWESLIALESLTNPRIRQEVGEISLVPEEDRVSGPGASWLMAPFTHIGMPSRFSDGTWGVYYCARSLVTAVREKAYHIGRFLAATAEPLGTTTEMRTLVGRVDSSVHDVRGAYAEVHDPEHYGPAQALARDLRTAGSNGIAYDSVRDQSGMCLAAFRPTAITRPILGSNLRFHFDGERIDRWFRFGEEHWSSI